VHAVRYRVIPSMCGVKMDYQERTYHGLQGLAARPTVSRVTGRWARRGELAKDPDEWRPSRALIEVPASGPTEREKTEVLRVLSPPEEGDFAWGYNGHGTSHTAAAVLATRSTSISRPSRSWARGPTRPSRTSARISAPRS